MSRLEQISIHMFDYEKLQDKLESLKSSYEISDKYDSTDKLSQIQISELINKKMHDVCSIVILPMIKQNQTKMLNFFSKKLPQFIEYCEEIDHLNYRLNPQKQKSYSNDQNLLAKYIIKIEKKKLPPTIKFKLLHLSELLMHHFEKMDILTRENSSHELEDLLFRIEDFESMKKDLYATILMYTCLMIGIDPIGKRLVSDKTFGAMAEVGNGLAMRLDEHTNKLLEILSPFETITTLKKNPEFNSSNFLTYLLKYQKNTISLDDFSPHLNDLKSHLESTYDISNNSDDIFEDLAELIQKIFIEKLKIYEQSHSEDLKIIESVLALPEITPLKADVSESFHVILNTESNS